MSLANKLSNIHANLNMALNDVNSALTEKGGTESVNIIGVGDKIRELSVGSFNSLVRYLIEKNSVVSVDGYARITIPENVRYIGKYTFYDCDEVRYIVAPSHITSIGDYAFSGCTSLIDISGLDNITSIGDYTFSGCRSLISITIPDSVITIGDYAFYGCKSLTSITIPDSVTSISEGCFYMCGGITTVTLGKSITNICDYAFAACSNLTDFYVKTVNPPTLGYAGITSTSSLTIHVPIGSGDAYKAATNWSKYADKIVEDVVVK